MTVREFLLRAQKFVGAATAFVSAMIAYGLLDGAAETWATGLLGALGVALVYLLGNKDSEGNLIDTSSVRLEEAVQIEKQRTAAASVEHPDLLGELPVVDSPAL